VATGWRSSCRRDTKRRSARAADWPLKHAITLPNSPATIDPGYRGEIRVILLNLGREPYEIHPGDRIAQMVIARYEAVEWEEGELNESRRGEGGFGSSGR
jgi:dUTP pyrophosphatase